MTSGLKWSSLAKCVIALWDRPLQGTCTCTFSARDLMAPQEALECGAKLQPQELTQQEADKALCEITVQVSVLTGCVLHTGTPAAAAVQLSQWEVFLSKWTPKNISLKGRVTYWNTCQSSQRKLFSCSLQEKSVHSREEEQVLSDFSPLWHIFHILNYSAAFCSPGIWDFFS